MSFDVLKIGALTSKPYAFTARSWELTSVESIDFFDPLCSSIRVDTRGSEIMRILPKVNNKLNEEWISDKVRFSYDGFKRQRLSVPMLRINGKLEFSTWEIVLSKLANYIKTRSKFDSLRFILGDFVDFETQIFVKFMVERFGFDVFFQDLSEFNQDFSHNYLLNSNVESFSKFDVFFLIGSNPRLESPLVNLKIRRRVNEGARVFYFGGNIDLGYKIINLGSDVNDLVRVVEGKHLLSKILINAINPLVIIGSSVFQRNDAKQFYNLLSYLKKFSGIDVAFLQNSSARIQGADLNIVNLNKNNFVKKEIKSANLMYILGADNVIVNKQENDLVVYQGHHGDRIASFADIILPGSTPIEKDSIYFNLEGKIYGTNFIFSPPGNARTDWKI